MKEALGSAGNGDGEKVEAAHQHGLRDGREQYYADLVLRRKATETEKKPLLLLLEVGVNCDWWKKADQNVGYIRRFLSAGVDASTVFEKAVLFAVLTINIDNQKRSVPKFKDPVFRSACFGVFVCTRAVAPSASDGKDSFRMSLLWRQESDSLVVTSKAIGKTLRAACLLPDLLDEVDRQGYEFEYLGPSCCRRGNRVRRLRIAMVLSVRDGRASHATSSHSF
jgi:hypothetical protein